MRWQIMLLLLSACSSTGDSNEKEKEKIDVHTQPAQGQPVVPAAEVAPGTQSFADGMTALCESYTKAPKSGSPMESQKLLHAWIGEHVTNEKVREVFTLVGQMPASQRSGMLRAAAAKVGISECALAGPDPSKSAAPAPAQ